MRSNRLSSIFGHDSVFISDNGTTVEAYLTRDGRKHSAAFINSKVKAATLFKAHEIITKAEYVFSSKYDEHSTTGKKYKGATWDYYVAVATYGRFNIPVRFTMIDSARDTREQIYKIGVRTEDASLTNRGQNELGAMSNAGEASSDNRVAQNGEEVKNGEKKTYYQLIDVDPVQPSSDAWSRTATTEEAMQAYPNLWNVAAEESETNNPTQRASTVSTYRNIYNILKKEGFSGKILDASSGMGFGTQLGRSKEFGFDVDDIEPYPGQNYKPKHG